ncbi:MAG: hypothetical protein NT129_04740 [Candidatus Aenigmarchaeota archaeon]|nr:hypothetical protein [Candidatus Aenigmarchaeota archaeon]
MSKEYKGKKSSEDPKNMETSYLVAARSDNNVIRALEEYSRHWDRLDENFGKGNAATKSSVREYQERVSKGELKQPDNDQDRKRLEIMEASLLYRRIYPDDVASVLIGMTLFGKK